MTITDLEAAVPVLEVQHLSKWYGKGDSRFSALNDISLTIRRGESLAIVGKSGSGKSTLMHILALLDTADEGSVLVDGQQARTLSTRGSCSSSSSSHRGRRCWRTWSCR